MASIQNPELYPLINQVAPVLPAGMEAATAMYDGDDVGALRWLQTQAMALGGAHPIDYLDSPEHIQDILDLIGRIEYGGLS